MSNKSTPISQDVVVNLKARTSEIENSVKSLMQKLQGTNLSDSFTKGYSSSLQKVLDKSQELKKTISDTNSVNSKTVADWSNSYNKLAAELTKTIAKIEGHSVKFSDLVSFDSSEYKQLKTALDSLKAAQKSLYEKNNVIKGMPKITDKALSGKTITNIQSNIKDEKEVTNILNEQLVDLNKKSIAEQKHLDLLKQELTAYQTLRDVNNDLSKVDHMTPEGRATLAYAKEKAQLPNATRKEINAAWSTGNFSAKEIKSKDIEKAETDVTGFNTKIAQIADYKEKVLSFVQQLATDFQALTQPIASAGAALKKFEQSELNAANVDLDKISTDANQIKTAMQGAEKTTEDYTDSLVQLETRQTFFSDLQSKITQIFGLANAFQALRRFVQESWTAIKELDAAFTEIAVVTEFTTGDLWGKFDSYNKMAQQLGVTTTDAIETSALYYQQGLDTADVMTLTTETIKMARIAGMDFADATQAMTSAIRGFKLEMSDAQSVTDVYSALAAEAAVDTDQLATAISKTASIAGSAGLSLENTSAFLTQIIETTQEAPETAGTALKTIIARFTELKKDPAILKVEGEEISANKVEKALKTANVALRDTEGNFRDLDEVFLELSSKWDSLDRNTQRYIATTAAGSRQQSRFIAMMDDYKRTTELVDIANDSAGAGAIQFAKTLDSVGARVNKLKSNFEALIGNLVENDTVKGILDVLNEAMKTLVDASEKGVVAFGALIFLVGKAVKSALTLVVSQFSDISKKNEELRTKIGKTIKTTVIYQPDLTLVNQVNKQLKTDPIKVGSDQDITGTRTYNKLQQKKIDLQEKSNKSYADAIKKRQTYANLLISESSVPISDPSQLSSEIEKARIAAEKARRDANKDVFKALTPTLVSTVSSGMAQGLAAGVISDDWRVGLSTGLMTTISGVLSNPAIVKGFGGMLTKSGGTVAKVLGNIGGALTKAGPYIAVAALIAGIGYSLWKWIDPIQETNRELKKAQDNLDKVNNNLESSRANFLSDVSKAKSATDDIETYKKLTSQIGLTTDEQTQLNDVTTKLAEQFPQIITGYTEAGQVIIDQKTNWQEILELQKQSIALSQGQYASDVIASVDATEATRKAEFNSTKAKRLKLESDFGIQAVNELTKEGVYDSDQYNMDEAARAKQNALVDKRIEEKKAASLDYQAALGEENKLEQQGALYAQQKANAYKQIADSLISSYQAYTTDGNGKVDSQISELAQNGLAKRVEGLGLNWNTDDEEVKKSNIAKARADADAYLIALQHEFETSSIDMTDVAEHMATDTEEQFTSFLEGQGITAKGENATLYATLMLDFDTKNAGVDQVLAAISGTPYTLKGDEQEIAVTNPKKYSSDAITSVISRESIAAAVRNKGAQAGADYVQGLYEGVINNGLDAKIADYLASVNITTQQEAKDAAAYIAATFDTPYTAAVDIVFNYKTDPKGIIDKQGLFDSTGIKSYFEDQIETNSADEALKTLDTGVVDLTTEQTKALVKEFPELSGALKVFANDADKGADAIKTLKEAIAKASNNKKSIEYFKKLSEQIEILKDTSSTDYAKDASKSIIKDSLGITDLENADEFVDTYRSDIEAAANGSVDAWNRVQAAIKEARLAKIGFKTEDQEKVSGFVNDFISQLDTLTNGDYSAEFTLYGSDKTSQLFQGVLAKIEDLGYSTKQAMAIIETMAGITIEPSVEKVQVQMPTDNGWDDRAVYRKNNGIMSVPKITYKVKKNDKYNPGYVGRKSKSGSTGGSDSPYEVKTDKYYNEIEAIERLNTELKKLADLRDKGNLTPEEYRNNLNQTTKYYKDLQDKVHNYSETLRADRAAIVNQILELKVPKAVTIVGGKAVVNKAELDALALTNKTAAESADTLISKLGDVDKALEENSDTWFEAKYALEELADKYLESFTSVEDKIREVLIKQDQDEIDKTEKKYDKLKEADEDYLEALKDNIDKRREARDKEKDYNDLAKKEKRLALLKRDTSGVYGAEILSLEEEIAQSRQELSDKEADDMVDSLEEQATKRADAYDKELKELQDLQEDKEKSMVEYNKEVDKIMQSGAENVLKWLQTYDEEYLTASETARQKYLEGWKATINEANGYVNNVANGTVMSSQDAASQKAQGIYSKLIDAGYGKDASEIQSKDATGAYNWYNSFIKDRKDLDESIKKLFWQIVVLKHQWDGSSSDYSEGGITRTAEAKNAQGAYSELSGISTEGLENASNPTYASAVTDLQKLKAVEALDWYNKFIKPRKGVNDRAKQLIQQIIKNKFMYETGGVPQNLGFSQGGLVDYTGPATVHGTKTKPEAFLSAADTKNFQILMELLNKAVNYKGDTQSNVPNALQIGECQIIVEVGSIADDYDVDQAIDKVKQSIVDNSNYRNVNIVTRKK